MLPSKWLTALSTNAPKSAIDLFDDRSRTTACKVAGERLAGLERPPSWPVRSFVRDGRQHWS
jgi:hypothetical protein